MGKHYEATGCDSGTCDVIAKGRDPDKVKRKAARWFKKQQKKHGKENVPSGNVHVEVRGVERGVYDTEATWEEEWNAGAPKARGRSRRRPAQAAVEE